MFSYVFALCKLVRRHLDIAYKYGILIWLKTLSLLKEFTRALPLLQFVISPDLNLVVLEKYADYIYVYSPRR